MSGVAALDSGALIKLGRNDREAIAVIKQLSNTGHLLLVPAPVLAETLRGKSRDDARINAWLKQMKTVPLSIDDARQAGYLLGSKSLSDTIDAMIVTVARAHHATIIVTTDPRDLAALAENRLELIAL